MKHQALSLLILLLFPQCLACNKKGAPPVVRAGIRRPLSETTAPRRSAAPEKSKAPRVIQTFPAKGSLNINPALSRISVRFNKPMRDKSWSWAYDDKRKFPQMTGQPYYTEGNSKNVLPVKLEPERDYVIWINSAHFKNFKDREGRPARPYKLTFTTGKGKSAARLDSGK